MMVLTEVQMTVMLGMLLLVAVERSGLHSYSSGIYSRKGVDLS